MTSVGYLISAPLREFVGLQVEDRRPAKRVCALKEEHGGDVAVDERLSRAVWVLGIELAEPADDKQ